MSLPHMVIGLSVIYDSLRIHHEFKGGIEKSFLRITICHHEACLVMTNGDREGPFLYPVLIQVMDYFSC